MSGFITWITSILGVVILGTVLDLISPEKKMNKFIKSVFATMTVLIIIMPLPSFFKSGFKFDNSLFSGESFQLDQSYLDFADKLKMDYLATGVEQALIEKGYKGVAIEIEGNFNNGNTNINFVRINLKNLSIDSELKNINKYEVIQSLVCEYLNIEKGLVIIYE